MIAADHVYMARALQLAERGLYSAHPNPRVGCVIVLDGEIVGEGWHRRAGEAHAEVHALQHAGARARGATVYVNLEPCCHTGRTPPCTQALINAGVARVVAAMTDPNPAVADKGLQQLAQAGISVESGIMQAQAQALNAGFIMRMVNRRPWVRCKLAMSLDGRTALANGKSQWITGPAARADVQRLRARSAAIMTGIGTVLSDDPSLTVRAESPLGASDEQTLPAGQPLRVILDSRLRTPKQARLLAAPGRTLICTGKIDASDTAWTAENVEILTRPNQKNGQKNGVDIHAVLDYLATRHEINEVLVEAGPTLSGAMLQAGLIDELVLYVAPMLLGDTARGLFHFLPALEDIQQHIALDIRDTRLVGQDMRITINIKK